MPLRLGARTFADDELIVMAIVNRTPDSFFDKGATFGLEAALARVDQVIAEGAGIVDVGGVKAGPGERVDTQEELRRTADLVAAIRGQYPDIVISVDTWRAEVADVVCGLGCDLVNDAWGGTEPAIFDVAAKHGAGIVCTHAGALPPRTRPHRVAYDDVMTDVLDVTVRLAERAIAAGVRPDGVLIDPGHDFGKNSRHSLEVTRRLPEMMATGWPVLVSLSRKDFIGEVLDLPPNDRLEGTLAATAISAWLGARVFRAHDVAATRRALDVVSAIRGDTDVRVARRGLA